MEEWNADSFGSQLSGQQWTWNEFFLAYTHHCTSGLSKAKEDLSSSEADHIRDWQMQIIKQEDQWLHPLQHGPFLNLMCILISQKIINYIS